MMDSLKLRKFLAPEIIFGVGALLLAGQYGRNLGGSKALIVSDPGVLAAGWTQKVVASVEGAGLESTLFTQVTPNPRIEEMAAGALVYAQEGCDIIIAVGGGSAIDCAKCIGLLAANPCGIRELVGIDKVGAPMPPTICIPTTAGTSADTSQFAVLLDRETRRKLLIISKAVVPDLALINPETVERIFDPFYTTKPSGMGMGLAISRSIIQTHGGRLWASSDGAGTTLQFTIPKYHGEASGAGA